MVHQFRQRHPLADVVSAQTPIADDHLSVVEHQAIVVVLAAAGHEASVAALLAGDEDISVRVSAPGEWLVLSGVQTPELHHQALSALLGASAHCIDQSHGRVLLRLGGPNARTILAKGIGIDLHPCAYEIGRSANMLCGHISINLARTGENQFEIIVVRSFAESLVHDLRAMGRAFDLSVSFAL